jgi:hypothetical protein
MRSAEATGAQVADCETARLATSAEARVAFTSLLRLGVLEPSRISIQVRVSPIP